MRPHAIVRLIVSRSLLVAALLACAALALADEQQHDDEHPATHRARQPGERIA